VGRPTSQCDRLGRRIASLNAYLTLRHSTVGPSHGPHGGPSRAILTLDAVRLCPELIPMMFDS
jgi:hypothetical protein